MQKGGKPAKGGKPIKAGKPVKAGKPAKGGKDGARPTFHNGRPVDKKGTGQGKRGQTAKAGGKKTPTR